MLNEVEELKTTMDRLLKDIKRQEKIMSRSDKRQKQEYDQLQHKLQEVEKLQEDQKNLLESFIKLIAEAIDAKSKYTGDHCEKVPELSILLAKEASASTDEAFKDFNLATQEQLREIDIASWLHDCGKVTTPEYIVDKATKLETIYNRIHEIRTRFEVIHRDLTIEALNKKLDGEDKEQVDIWLEKQHQKLYKEFEVLAEANLGSEFMGNEQKKLIKKIAKRTWTRHFDNTIGLAHDEKARIKKDNPTTPQEEKLLDDKVSHLIDREHFNYEEYKAMGFKQDVPEHLYNLGEVYNLLIDRGTLTYEERFKINEHVIMTIKMLENLPFPENLSNVPLFAGAHHETLIGTGYPRQLKKDDMPIVSRIIAIADVFEALTASDRPYKKAKSLSQSIEILNFMVKDQHLDPDLFKLFLKSGLYKKYADEFLDKTQIDEVDINKYL